MTDSNEPEQATDATTLLSVLTAAAEAGYRDQIMVTDDGRLRCTKCDTTVSAADFHVEGFQRLEGASDPADMLIVVWGHCAGCDRGGVAIIGYGPNAGPADSDVLDALDLEVPPEDAGSAPA